MPSTTKILGQVQATAATLTALYTVPSGTSATGSTITACNRAATATTFRISAAINGAADANAQYIYYDVTIPANDTFAATIGITLSVGDVIRVYSASGNVAFSLFGIEVTP